MHRATSDDDFSLSVVWKCLRKCLPTIREDKQAQTLISRTCQRTSVAFCSFNMGSFNPKSEFRKPENLNKPIAKGEKTILQICHFSENSRENNYAHVIMTAEADSLTTDTKQLLEDCGLVGCHPKTRQLSCQSMHELTQQDMLDSCGNQLKKKTKHSHAAIF